MDQVALLLGTSITFLGGLLTSIASQRSGMAKAEANAQATVVADQYARMLELRRYLDDIRRPEPLPTCSHADAVPVDSIVTGESLAKWCQACSTTLYEV